MSQSFVLQDKNLVELAQLPTSLPLILASGKRFASERLKSWPEPSIPRSWPEFGDEVTGFGAEVAG